VSSGNVVVEAPGGGVDTVVSGVDWLLEANVENLLLRGTKDLQGTGNGLDNELTGNAGDNLLRGGQGDDVLRGRSGNDTLVGGGGADAFLFDTALSGSKNVDRVLDFQPGTDRLWLDPQVFTALSAFAGSSLPAVRFVAGPGLTAGQDAGDRIVYDTATGSLYYDPDGSGSGQAQLFAVLGADQPPAVQAGDFLIVG